MQVNLRELLAVASIIVEEHLETGSEDVELDVDYYWHIPTAKKYDPYTTPDCGALTLGQLSDDVKELIAIANSTSEPTSYALVWLAAVVRAVGETLGGGLAHRPKNRTENL
jgi:hypothetical protein